MRGVDKNMFNRFAVLAAVCIATPVGTAPLAAAQPPPPPPPSAGDQAIVPLDPTNPLPPRAGCRPPRPGVLDTPDGWHLEVVGSNETQFPVAPLTTAISSREYLIAGTFVGKITGGGKTKLTGGSLEAGEQIGCGIVSDETEINPGASLTPALGPHGSEPRCRILVAGQGVSEAGHCDHRCARQEVVQGHLDASHDHRCPRQDRPVRRPVVHSLLRDADLVDRQHR